MSQPAYVRFTVDELRRATPEGLRYFLSLFQPPVAVDEHPKPPKVSKPSTNKRRREGR